MLFSNRSLQDEQFELSSELFNCHVQLLRCSVANRVRPSYGLSQGTLGSIQIPLTQMVVHCYSEERPVIHVF